MKKNHDLSGDDIDPFLYEKATYSVRLENNFYEFVKEAWDNVFQTPLTDIPLIKISCDHMQALYDGTIPSRRLCASEPPGFVKSGIACVFFPAWVWTKRPEITFLTGSHSKEFATRDAKRSRGLMMSSWYQYLWGHKFSFSDDQNKKTNYENDKKGYRYVFGTSSGFTGTRADIILYDDPLDSHDAESEVKRNEANTVAGKLHTRLNISTDIGVICIIAQRLHVNDAVGHVLSKKLGFEYLCVPLEFKQITKAKTSIFEDNRKEDENLWPEKFPPKVIAEKKASMGSRDYNAQYQQNPEAESGSIIKREWLMHYIELPKMQYIIMAMDTAFTKKKTSDYSAISIWGISQDGFYLIDLFWDKLEFPELKHKTISMYNAYKPHKVIIEKASSGHGLISELERNSRVPVEGIVVDGSKEQRLYIASPLFEAKKVFFPKNAVWLNDYEDELMHFPAVTHDDRTDTTSMALIHLSQQCGTPSLRSL